MARRSPPFDRGNDSFRLRYNVVFVGQLSCEMRRKIESLVQSSRITQHSYVSEIIQWTNSTKVRLDLFDLTVDPDSCSTGHRMPTVYKRADAILVVVNYNNKDPQQCKSTATTWLSELKSSRREVKVGLLINGMVSESGASYELCEIEQWATAIGFSFCRKVTNDSSQDILRDIQNMIKSRVKADLGDLGFDADSISAAATVTAGITAAPRITGRRNVINPSLDLETDGDNKLPVFACKTAGNDDL